MVSHANGPSGSRQSLTFGYDSQWRRISKVVSNWAGSTWTKQSENRFVYDGWNLLGVLSESNTLRLSFRWGTDLSGSMQGAGGVGGLISITVHTGTVAGVYFSAYDGNGNVVALLSAANSNLVAQYEYDPFGSVLRANGSLALVNPFRFSTKYVDGESDFNYYGHRFYNPLTGRWMQRDPIMEFGGENLAGFTRNNPVALVDHDGRQFTGFPPYYGARCPKPCEDPCGAAKVYGLDRGNAGATICCGGRKYACVFKPGITTNEKAQKIATFCIGLHESNHVDSAVSCPSSGLSNLVWPSAEIANAEECDSYTKHLACLDKRKGDCGADTACLSDIARERVRVRIQKTIRCGQKMNENRNSSPAALYSTTTEEVLREVYEANDSY